MRFAPVAVALSLLAAVTASMGRGATPEADPRAAALIAQGRSALQANDVQQATDAFEAALAVDPGHTPILLHLAEAARANGLQGKAIHYYREALTREPDNLAALSGEGQALFEKGAIEKARRNLAKLQSMCGASCAEAKALETRIAAGPPAPALAADTVKPTAVITQN